MNEDDDLPIVDEPHVFNIDYFDLEQVKALARKLGKGNYVIKYPDRPNYNITHVEGYNLPKEVRVIYRT